ncbi:MAG TPA: hypothetical protein IAB07_01990 [Candidatus Caccalectryoclostridium excrementigallinarum]|uniref:Uncharacterized protein n=1 Tax=Candidatus Caccalectryoclostridium excrementigallinarum TaxID=2840710 RepID=A0A9D1SJI9_9FIRM|nr:hypothetical protein [Candidatus Caccalectryoclostridium excrementigallinarum]
MIRELRHSASKLRRVESNFGGLAALGALFGSLPKLPHPIFFAQGKKYVGALSPEGAPKTTARSKPCYFNADNDQGASTFRKQVAESRKQFRRLSRVERAFWFFAEIAAPNAFCVWQKALGFDVPRDQKIDDTEKGE